MDQQQTISKAAVVRTDHSRLPRFAHPPEHTERR